MTHTAKDFSGLLGTLDGISDAQLSAHFKLYEGYVKKLNEIEEKLATVDRSLTNYSYGDFSELKRREAVAFNGAYLHQMYFENLSGGDSKPSAALITAIEEAFGDIEKAKADLKASAASTPGWVVVTKSRVDGKLHHYIMYEHHVGLPVEQDIILTLDCWEHAFMIDYGTAKGEYLDAFIKNINWDLVNERFEKLA